MLPTLYRWRWLVWSSAPTRREPLHKLLAMSPSGAAVLFAAMLARAKFQTRLGNPAPMRSLLVGIAIVIAGATATRAQTLPFYNIDELTKKCVETAAEAATKYSRLGDLSSFLADEAVCKALSNMERQSLDELVKNWNLLTSSIRLQCIANRSVDSYFGLKQCFEHAAKRGREIALRKQ